MKLTRRQLYKLINESLNINEARVPRPRRLIKNIDDASARVDTLIGRLSAGEGRYTKAELEADREELNQYLDNLKIALDREFGIKPRQRRKVAPVKNKIEDFLAGNDVETDASSSSSSDSKNRKTRAERKANRRSKGAEIAMGIENKKSEFKKNRKARKEARKAKGAEVAMGIVHMIGELKKKLKDETNKRRKQALEKTIAFLEERQKALKKGEDVTEQPIPPEVAKEITGKILKTKAESDAFMGAISGQFTTKADLDAALSSLPNYGESEQEDEETPTSGTESLAQTPESDFEFVTDVDEVKKAITDRPVVKRTVGNKSNAGNMLTKISMSAIKSYNSIDIPAGGQYSTPEEFLNSDTGTSEYFHSDGSTRSSNYDFLLVLDPRREKYNDVPTFMLSVDGSLAYNATIKGFVVVKIKNEYFAVHKSKINSVLTESNLFMRKGMLLGESRASLYRKRYWGRY